MRRVQSSRCEGHVDAIRPHTSRQVAALVDLQLLTASRSGKLMVMQPIDLNTTGTVWTYTPKSHKTAHHRHSRTIYIGPRGQAVIRPFLAGRAVDAFLFSPAEAEAERRAKQHQARKTPLSCGNAPGRNRKRTPSRQPGTRYTRDLYRRAVQYACRKAGIPRGTRTSLGTWPAPASAKQRASRWPGSSSGTARPRSPKPTPNWITAGPCRLCRRSGDTVRGRGRRSCGLRLGQSVAHGHSATSRR